jgi:membrane-associated phospholipid phosphatase
MIGWNIAGAVLRRGSVAAVALGTLALGACSESAGTATASLQPEAVAGRAVAGPRGATTLDWNAHTRALVRKYSTGAGPAIRVYALVSLAQAEGATAAHARQAQGTHASMPAAIAAASATVLAYLYPAETVALEERVDSLEAVLAGSPHPRASFAAGEGIGRAIGAGIVEAAKVDGFFKPFTGTVPVCDGCWRADPTPPALATLGEARTFFLSSGSQFRPAPPPAFGSPAFLEALAEVRTISDTRTAAQDSIAKFWSLQGGTVTPLGYWNEVAAALIAERGMDDRRAAHLLAMMNLAGYDALVASHEAKYTYWLIRPTQADPAITLPIALPSFPAYPSNHAAISAAAATVLGASFPRERRALARDAEEAGISRIYGGIHYRFDSDAGLELGRKVGRHALQLDRLGRGPLTR